MEILTKLDRVFESSNSCIGCGSLLGLKMLLQSTDDLKNVVLVTSPGEIAQMGRTGLRVNLVNSRDPAATARGIAAARPDLKVIAYAGDVYTGNSMPSLLSAEENFLYVCYNNTCYVENSKMQVQEFAGRLIGKATYSATASVAYYEDFIAKIKKAFSKNGFKFIDLLCPCPAIWKYDTSNTIEIGRMATETLLWPLYEIDAGGPGVTITKTPPQSEPIVRYTSALKASLSEAGAQALQERVSRRWKLLNEGRFI